MRDNRSAVVLNRVAFEQALITWFTRPVRPRMDQPLHTKLERALTNVMGWAGFSATAFNGLAVSSLLCEATGCVAAACASAGVVHHNMKDLMFSSDPDTVSLFNILKFCMSAGSEATLRPLQREVLKLLLCFISKMPAITLEIQRSVDEHAVLFCRLARITNLKISCIELSTTNLMHFERKAPPTYDHLLRISSLVKCHTRVCPALRTACIANIRAAYHWGPELLDSTSLQLIEKFLLHNVRIVSIMSGGARSTVIATLILSVDEFLDRFPQWGKTSTICRETMAIARSVIKASSKWSGRSRFAPFEFARKYSYETSN